MRWLSLIVVALLLAAGTWLLLDGPAGDEAPNAAMPIGRAAASLEPEPNVAPLLALDATEAAVTELRPERVRRDPPMPPAWTPTGRIVGRVVGSAGEPIERAWLELLPLANPARLTLGLERAASPVITTTSAADGAFEFAAVPAGFKRSLRASARGGRLLERDNVAALIGETLDLGVLALDDGASIAGVVRDGTGANMAGLDVLLAEAGDSSSMLTEFLSRRGCGSSHLSTDVRVARTDEQGRFTFSDVAPASCEVALLPHGFAPWRTSFTPRSGEASRLDVTLLPGGRIAGRTVDEAGRPVADAYIFASVAAKEFCMTCCRSNRDGTFELLDLPEGRYSLTAYAEGFSSSGAQAEQGTLDVTLQLQPKVELPPFDVEVVDEFGAPAATFELWTGLHDFVQRFSYLYGDEARTATIRRSLASMRGFVWAEAPGRISNIVQLGSLKESLEPVRLKLLPSVAVEGRIVDAMTGEPLPGAELNVELDYDIEPPEPRLWTDADGRFAVDALPPAAVTLRIRAAGHREMTVSILEDGRAAREIRVPPCGTLVLHASEAWCKALGRNAQVHVGDGTGHTIVEQDAQDLPCVLTPLEGGDYSVELRRTDQDGELASQPIDFQVVTGAVTRIDVSYLALPASR
ncbi:MAG TPA: carboxypeptidase regulatory-like domain-containing protein [Planctomycetota bacterium]|nr:carboxypeptidase regulatory-like domain-containing protein [Planctomycetota bacterium]